MNCAGLFVTTLITTVVTFASAQIPMASVGGATPSKTVHYRGGLVTFSIPRHWREELEPDGWGMYYAPGTDTGTLRVNLIVGRTPSKDAKASLRQILAKFPGVDESSILTRADGSFVARGVSTAEEKSTSLTIHSWYVLVVKPQGEFSLANFSHTILTARASEPQTIQELRFLGEALPRAQVSADSSK